MPQQTKEEQQNQKLVWDEFTNKYELSKTLRFELKPVGKTAELLKQNQVFEKDKLIDDHYHEIKFYFDTLHREFIDETLKNINFSKDTYQEYWVVIKRLKTAGKEYKKEELDNLEKIETKLRQEIVKQFNETANNLKKQFVLEGVEFKKEGIDIFFEEAILTGLKYKFPKAKNLLDSFKGFFTYFTNFNNTKKNLYSDKDQGTAVANRAINENLRKFISNVILFNERKDDYLQCGLTEQEKKIFELEFYNQCFTQDGIDNYNWLIGGFVTESGEKIKGINEKINLYNQQHKDKKLRQFARLFKQIMSKKDKAQRFVEITDDNKVFPLLKEFIKINDDKLKIAQNLMNSFLKNNEAYDLGKIYVKGAALNTISQKWFNNWSVIGNLLRNDSKKKSKKFNGENGEIIKLPDFVSIAQLKNVLKLRSVSGDENYIAAEDLFREDYKNIYKNTKNHYETFLGIWKEKSNKSVENYETAKNNAELMMKDECLYQKDNEQQIEKIKNYCDAALATFRMMKYFALEKGRKKVEPDNGIDSEFYNLFNDYYQDYQAPAYYNEFRNYLTKKAHLGRLLFPSLEGNREQRHPLSKRAIDGAEKIKLNFENGTLLDGWADSPEGNTQFCGFIFKKNSKYFLGISSDPKILDRKKNKKIYQISSGDDTYEKMVYKQIKSTSIYGSCYIGKYKTKYADDKGKLKDKELVDRIKSILKERYLINYPQLKKVINKNYTTAKDLAKDIRFLNLYSLKFTKINAKLLKNLSNTENKEKFYLFEITNKDFKKKKQSADNLHTLYFKSLFDTVNLSNPVLKLSGGAEIFFRPKSESLRRKKDKRGKEVVDHKRYGEDKIFLHIPIVLNMGAGGSFGFNSQINKLVADDKKERKIKIIGIDRGEKNLAYFALINQNGKLLDCGDLNGRLPNGETYLQKLEARAGKSDEAQKEWKTIENIKELKNGYISWLVRCLSDMMLKGNAVLVFEDLSVGFKRGRQKIKQQVYQKLELALAQKLNYLVQKDAQEGAEGHYLKGYQLTPQVSTPQDIGKQCGAVFYVSPGYTSLTCPKCGYRKNISFNFENIKKAREIIKKTELRIFYKNNAFRISYKSFDEKGEPKGIYKVCSNVKRMRWHKKGTEYAKADPVKQGEKIIKNSKSGVVKEYDMTAVLKQLFDGKIEYTKQKLSAKELSVPESADYYRRLFWCFNLLLHSRNSVSNIGSEEEGRINIDYIQCPKCLFHSDKGFQGHLYNGDANGAYNIARKGLIALRKIQNAPDPAKIKWGDLKISVNDWDAFVQKV